MPPSVIKTDHNFSVFSLEADRDYILARHISFIGGGFHSRAGFFGQQACEKYMKALSVQASGEYLQTHLLMKLAESCEKFDAYFSEQTTKDTLQTFDRFEQVGRYGAAANFDPLAQKNAEFETAGVMLWKEEYRSQLDAFVFKVRGMLNYEAIRYSNSIKAILERNRKDILAAEWQGRPPIRVVLTKNNSSFK